MFRSISFFVFSILLSVPIAQAADPTLQKLLETIERLEKRVAELESDRATPPPTPKNSQALPAQTLPAQTLPSPIKRTESAELKEMTADQPAESPGFQTTRQSGFGPGASYVRDIASNTTVGGYASIEFENFESSDSTFDPQRFILNVSSQLHERLKFYSEIEYEHGTKIEAEGSGEGSLTIEDTDGDGVIDAQEAADLDLSVDTRNGAQGELSLEQAYLQYDFTERLGLRAGVILAPFGRFNLYHDDDLNNLTDRPLVVRRVIPSTWSESGAGLVSSIPVGDESTVNTEVYVVQGLDDEISSGSGGLRDARSALDSDNNNNKAFVGRIALSPGLGHEVGLSGYHGNYDDDGNAIGGGALDGLTTLGNFQLHGEWALFSVDDGTVADGGRAPEELSGFYAELGYRFWLNALSETFLGAGFEDPRMIATYRYNNAEIQRRGELATLDGDGHVVGLAYRPITNFVLKTEFQWNDGELERGNSNGFITSLALGF